MKRISEKTKRRMLRIQGRRTARNIRRRRRKAFFRRTGAPPPGFRLWKTVPVSAPKWLCLRGDEHAARQATLKFFAKILTTPDLELRRRVLVDMRSCQRIDVTAAVVLIATLETAQLRYPDAVNGIDPVEEEPYALLRALRFHQHLDYMPRSGPLSLPPDFSDILEIETRSGGLDGSAGEKMPLAAEAISEILPRFAETDEEASLLREEIHRAMNEALLNVLNHAYSSKNPTANLSSAPLSERRWWAVGVVNKRDCTFDLLVYDRGVGIPRTLRPSVREWFTGLLSSEPWTDGLSIKAAMEYGRTRKKRGELGGKGMPEMLELLTRFPEGMLLVESLKGLYIASHEEGRLEQSYSDNENALPGTLIYWHFNLIAEG